MGLKFRCLLFGICAGISTVAVAFLTKSIGFERNPKFLIEYSPYFAVGRIGLFAYGFLLILLIGWGAGLPFRKHLLSLSIGDHAWTNRLQFAMQMCLGFSCIRLICLILGELSLLTVPNAVFLSAILASVGTYGLLLNKPKIVFVNNKVFSSLVILLIILIVITKAVPLSSDGDYLTHYGPYFNQVLDKGNTWSTDLWYHYWFSKGNGGGFLAISLTGAGGQVLYSLASVLTLSLLLGSWIFLLSKSKFLGISTFLICVSFSTQSSVVELSKHHVDAATLLLTSAFSLWWIAQGFGIKSVQVGKITWVFTSISFTLLIPIGLGYLTVLIFSISVATSVVDNANIIQVLRKNTQLLIFPAIGQIFVGLLNYSRTGFIEATPYRLWRNFADLSKLPTNVSPYLIAALDAGTTFENPSAFSIYSSLYEFFLNGAVSSFLFLFVTPTRTLFVISSLVLILLIAKSWVTTNVAQHMTQKKISIYLGLTFFLSISPIAFLGQAVSLSRSSWYLWLYLLIIFASLISMPEHLSYLKISDLDYPQTTSLLRRITITALPLVMVFCFVLPNQKPVIDLIKFSTGKINLTQLSNQDSESLILLETIINQGGCDKNFLSLNWNSFGGPLHLTQNQVISGMSYSMGRRGFTNLLFGSPSAAVSSLRELGIRCVFFNKNAPLDPYVSHSPAFQTASLNSNFKIVRLSQTTFLMILDGRSQPSHPSNQNLGKTVSKILQENAISQTELYDFLAQKFKLYGFDPLEIPIFENEKPNGWQ